MELVRQVDVGHVALRARDPVRPAAGMFALLDEARRELWLPLILGVITLAVIRHPVAPEAAAAAGPALAVGFVAVHWLPEWSELSDSFVDGDAELLSWLASGAEIAGAVLVGLAGWAAVRARRTVT